MSVDKSLDAVNTKLAKTVGYVEKIEKAVKNVNGGSSTFAKALNGIIGGTPGVGGSKPVASATFGGQPGAASTNTMATSLGRFNGTPAATGGGGGAAPTGAGGAPGGGNGNLMGGALGVIGAGVTAAWNMTPGVRDYAAMQGALFPTAFGMQGGYSNRVAKEAIRQGIGNGASGWLDPTAAAAMGSMSGLSFNLGSANGGTALGNALGAASFSYQMMGMSNQAAMSGQISLFRGKSGVSSTLSKIGIYTVDMNSGKPKDMGQIVDDLWARFYGSKNAKITMEQFDADLLMGFLGADLQTMFGSNPDLYNQVVAFMRVKAKAGGRAGMRMSGGGSNNVANVAKGLGMSAQNTPTVKAGEVSALRANTASAGLESGMQGYVTASDAVANVNKGMVALYDTLGPLAEGFTTLKTYLDTFTSSNEGSGIVGLVTGIAKAVMPFATGGGNSTSDTINARLSPGEFVSNARAAQQIGLKNLKAMNDSGKVFGSGFASPTQFFDDGGLARSATDAVSWATNSTTGDAKFPGLCDRYVANVYGQAHSGYDDAQQHWDSTPSNLRHPGDRRPPTGALVFWSSAVGGGHGHAAVVTGYNEKGVPLISTTHLNGGQPTIVPLDGTMDSAYLGWATPYFQGKTAAIDGSTSSASGVAPADPGSEVRSRILSSGKTGAALPQGLSGTTYSAVMGTSLAGLGKSSGQLGTFNTGYVNASTVGNNAKTLATLTGAGEVPSTGVQGLDLIASKSMLGSSSPRTTASGSAATSAGKAAKGQLAEWLRQAGFEGEHLREAWAIAMRESGGNPSAHNIGPKDDSYGLFQINFKPVGGLDPAKRDASLRKNVAGYSGPKSLLDPLINARAAAYMSARGRNWSSWVSPQYGKAATYYDQYAESAAHGMASTHAGVLNVHEGEMVMPAAQAQEFRQVLREVLAGGRRQQQPVNITLKIEKASDEEARRFAAQVKRLLEDDMKVEGLAG